MLNALLRLTLSAALVGSGPGGRVSVGSGPGGGSYDGAAGDLEVATPTLDKADIRVDGRLDDEDWNRAAVLHSFTQYDPVEGVPASQRTEVLVLVDAQAIYFGVRAHDDHPAGVRATMSQRDKFDRSDDYIRIVLDTFDDQRRAYVFSINPLGVQQDGVWNEGGGGGRGHMGPPIDDNPDFLWESGGQLTDWGYSIEVRIPFKSLRFREIPEQSWGLQVIRKISRNGYQESWAPITKDISNQLAQEGKLNGLKNLDAGLFMEVNPVMTGKRIGALDDNDVFSRGRPRGSFGLNFTYGLTSNLTLDATYNPDFSQVEADAGQISVNERFGLYFPEKRPFFLEGTEIFNTPKQVVYTRSIANPIGGAKLTGKVGAWNVGYIGAQDKALSEDGTDAVANLLRIRRDLGAASTVGMVYTDRTAHSDQYNRLLGSDARLVFDRRYTLTLFGAGSRTAEPGTDPVNGMLWSAKMERAGRAFSFSTELEDSNDGFQAGSGFIRRIGYMQGQANIRLNHYGERGALVENWGPSLEVHSYWDHHRFWSGLGTEETSAQLGGSISFRGNISVFTNLKWTAFDFQADRYDGLFAQAPDGTMTPFYPDQSRFQGLWGADANIWVSTFQRIRGNVRFSWNQVPIFSGSSAATEAADSYSGNVSLNLYPTRSLQGELGLRTGTIYRMRDGTRYSTAVIPRIRAQYQFSRAFYVRGIFEYSSQDKTGLFDPASGQPLFYCDDEGCEEKAASASHDIHVEGLVTYEPSPGTVFYIGYTRQMQEPDAFRFRQVTPVADGIFVKLSYRFRF
jgi:hypothetical protein